MIKGRKNKKEGEEMKKERQVFIIYCSICDDVIWFNEKDFEKYELDCCCGLGKGKKILLLGALTED